MTKSSKVTITVIVATFFTVPLAMMGFRTGPEPGATAGPGENPDGCAQLGCHVGTGNPTRGSGVAVEFPEGNTYAPGEEQTWTIRVTGAQTPIYGFQVSARVESDNSQAGAFAALGAGVQVICGNGTLKPAQGCPSQFPIEYPEHSQPNQSGVFEVRWTAPASNVGNIRVFVAGNAANNDLNNTGDRIFLNNFTLTPRAAPGPAPTIRSEQPVLQAFDFGAGLSPGTWIQIFGSNLAPTTRQWAGSDFDGDRAPTALDGVRVSVNGRPAFISYISPGQVNAQVPDDVGAGAGTVEVENANGRSSVNVNVSRLTPALLTTADFSVGGRQYAAMLYPDFTTFVGRPNLIPGVAFRAARPGDTVILYAVGCGPTNPASPAGQIVRELRPLASPFQVRFGNAVAEAQAFMEPNFIGLCRFNITVPNIAGDAQGDINVVVTVDGVAASQNLFTTMQSTGGGGGSGDDGGGSDDDYYYD